MLFPNKRIATINNKGFTLIEIIIALAIAAVLSIMLFNSLRIILHAQKHLNIIDHRLINIEFAAFLIRRDFSQIIQRPIINEQGHTLGALITPTLHDIAFTKGGVYRSQTHKKSTLERIEYEWKDHCLNKLTWPVLDRHTNTHPHKKTILKHIKHMDIRYLTQEGYPLTSWPPKTKQHTRKNNEEALPQGVIITFETEQLGTFKLVLPITVEKIYEAS